MPGPTPRQFPNRGLVQRRLRPKPPWSYGPPAIAQRNGSYSTNDVTSLTITAAFAAVGNSPANNPGNLIVASVGFVDVSGTTTCSVADTAGNTYFAAGAKVRNATNSYAIFTFYAWGINQSTSTNTVTFTLSTTSTFRRASVHEYIAANGMVWTSDPLDKTSTATGTGTALNSGSQTTTTDGQLIVGWGFVNSGTVSAGAGFRMRQPSAGGVDLALVDANQVTAGSIAALETGSVSDAWGMRMATFMAPTLPAAPPVQPQATRRRFFPMWLRRPRSTWVPPIQAAPAAPTYPPQAQRARLARPALLRQRKATLVPLPQPLAPPAARVRPVRVARLRPKSAQPIIPAAAPTAPTYPPQSALGRLRAVWPVRRRVGGPVPAQVSPVPPASRGRVRVTWLPLRRRAASVPTEATPVPVNSRPRVRVAWLARHRNSVPVPVQVTPPPPTYVPDRVRRFTLRAFAWRRPRSTDVPNGQIAPPAGGRARPRHLRIPQARAAQVVPPQIAPTPPTYPPQSARSRARAVRLPRGRSSTPVPTQVAPAAPTFVPEAFRQALRIVVRLLRGRSQAPVPVQAAPPPSRGRVKVRLLVPPRRRGVQFIPAQVAPPTPPAYPPGRSRLRVWALRVAAKRPVNGWLISVSDVCPPPTTRPDIGDTLRPTGTTTRPAGTTTRPTGITARPLSTTARPTGTTARVLGNTARSTGTTARPGGTTAKPTGITPRPDSGETDSC